MVGRGALTTYHPSIAQPSAGISRLVAKCNRWVVVGKWFERLGPMSSGDVAAASGGNKWRVNCGVGGSDVGGVDVGGVITGGTVGTLGLGVVDPAVLPEAGVGRQAAPAVVAALDSSAHTYMYRRDVLGNDFRLFLDT